MDRMNDSIIVTIKKMLGLDDAYTPFDTDVIVLINAAFMTLCQMGIGPREGYEVSDYDQTWDEFLTNKVMLGAVKTWVYLQVKMGFDPPTNSFVMDAMKQQSEQILFRLNVQAESVERMPFMTEDDMNGFLYGGSDDNIALENGLKFRVDWLRGQKTGFFGDQRENRSLLEKYAKGKRVLNMFCYTGGFSFYAMRGGAELVHSVDSSEKAIALTKENVALNFPDDSRHAAYCEDAFKFLDSIGNNHTTYNLIVLDPPAFAKHRGALHNALKGYTRLNQKAFEKIEKGGILFTFSCSQVVTKDHFRNAVFTAAALAKRKVRILHQLHQPADHPINIYHPEGEYLKGLVLYVE